MSDRIYNRIRELRWLFGLTTYDIAKRGGLSQGEVSMVENGKRIPNQFTMVQISKGLGIPVGKIFILDWTCIDEEDLKDHNGK